MTRPEPRPVLPQARTLLAQVVTAGWNAVLHRRTRVRTAELTRHGPPLQLEVGAGGRKGQNGWHTIDLAPGCDLPWDLRRGLPFPDGSVSKIYSSHFLEHLTFDECQRFLTECRRVLRPGGVISACVPDARLYVESYFGVRDLDPTRFMQYAPAFPGVSKIDALNYVAYMDGQHKYLFDVDALVNVLAKAGFENARRREFDPELDMEERRHNSVYAVATK
jgi:predicted SAM-dependent methyltransferase